MCSHHLQELLLTSPRFSFGRELFTDTGQYVLRFDSVAQDELLAPRIASAVEPGQPLETGRDLVESEQSTRALTLDERAVALATAVSVDFDYFSRHSRGGSGGMFPFIWWGGSSPREAEAGAEGEPPVTGEGQDSRGVMGNPEAPGMDGGAGAAAGTAAGYGMMGGGGGYQDAPPSQDAGAPPPPEGGLGGWDAQKPPPSSGQDPWAQGPTDSWSAGPESGVGGEDVWGSSEPWSQEPPSGGEGGGGLIQGLWDMFGGDE
jgi:Scramblase